jgi:hypothetical protein
MGGLFGRLRLNHCVTSQAKNAGIADWFRLPRRLPAFVSVNLCLPGAIDLPGILRLVAACTVFSS